MANIVPENVLYAVQTYHDASLASLQNQCCFLDQANKKLRDFEQFPANLGTTIQIERPFRARTVDSLVAQFAPVSMLYDSLTIDTAISTSFAFDTTQFVYTTEQYIEKFGEAAISEIGATIERNLAKHAITDTYRFYNESLDEINSYGQLAQALALFRNFGTTGKVKGFLPDVWQPGIVTSGLTEFALKRNEKISNDWYVGTFSNCDWFNSNQIWTHEAGTIGNEGTVLTVVSTDDPTGANITQIVCTSAGSSSDSDAIHENDSLYFIDVSGEAKLRALQWTGHGLSSSKVQMRATSASATSGGTITLNIYPALCSQKNPNQNINMNIVSGMQIKAVGTHMAGLIYCADAFYLAMPNLPDQMPFPTSNKVDKETGAAIRLTYGCKYGEDFRGLVYDGITGAKLISEYGMKLCFPIY